MRKKVHYFDKEGEKQESPLPDNTALLERRCLLDGAPIIEVRRVGYENSFYCPVCHNVGNKINKAIDDERYGENTLSEKEARKRVIKQYQERNEELKKELKENKMWIKLIKNPNNSIRQKNLKIKN